MKELVWLNEAETDLELLTDFIARDGVARAVNIREEIERQTERLRVFPHSGRVGRLKGTRELVVARTPFIVIYTLNDAIILMRVLHGAQQWPPRDEDAV